MRSVRSAPHRVLVQSSRRSDRGGWASINHFVFDGGDTMTRTATVYQSGGRTCVSLMRAERSIVGRFADEVRDIQDSIAQARR